MDLVSLMLTHASAAAHTLALFAESPLDDHAQCSRLLCLPSLILVAMVW
jgi:hypothetical protein